MPQVYRLIVAFANFNALRSQSSRSVFLKHQISEGNQLIGPRKKLSISCYNRNSPAYVANQNADYGTHSQPLGHAKTGKSQLSDRLKSSNSSQLKIGVKRLLNVQLKPFIIFKQCFKGMLTLWLFSDVHHTWEELEVVKISILRKDAGTGGL